MAKILIYAIPDDYHVHAVVWGLRKFGVECEILVAGDLPDHCRLSARFDDEGARLVLRQKGRTAPARLDDVDLVWNRRVAHPVAPAGADEYDRAFIEYQSYEHINGMRHLLGRRVRTVNHPAAQGAAARKTVQLEQARRSGFATPATLISNDFEEIRAFWDDFAPLVVKPFRTAAWKKDGQVYAYFTAPMIEPVEALREELELCPQIFQQRIDRVREIRLIAFGGRFYATAIEVEGGGLSQDIRYDMRNEVARYTIVDVAEEVRAKVRHYMAALGIDYGAFDFAVTPEGEWVFLECNEGGQFLFLESALPEIGMLDGFCRWFCELMSVAAMDSVPRVTIADFEAAGGCAANPPSAGIHKVGVIRGSFFREDGEEVAAVP